MADEFEGRPGEVLLPDSYQWNEPTLDAFFDERDGDVYVCPWYFGTKYDALHPNESDGMTIFPKGIMKIVMRFPMCRVFHDFTWAQIGFAGATEISDSGRSCLEHPIAKVVENLEYAIGVCENFPFIGSVCRMAWVWERLKMLQYVYRWFRQAHLVCPKAVARFTEMPLTDDEMPFTDDDYA